MGYDVHITRRADWWEEEGHRISTDEWSAVVASDSDLGTVQVARASPWGDDAVLEYRTPWLAQMVTHPEAHTYGAWLNWRDGRIVVKNPDGPMLAKMVQIALKLGARVQGDDGEYYD